MTSIARSQRMLYGQRRASSAEPRYYNNWGMSTSLNPSDLQQDHEPLPDVVDSLFNPSFLNADAGFTLQAQHPQMFDVQQCDPISNPALALQISPLDHLDSGLNSASTWSTSAMTPADAYGNSWMQAAYQGHSPNGSPSTLSVTPPPTEAQTPPHMNMNMYAQSEMGYTQMPQIAGTGIDPLAPAMEDLGVSFNQQIDMNYHPVNGDVSEYQSCFEQPQMYHDMGMHAHYMSELAAQY